MPENTEANEATTSVQPMPANAVQAEPVMVEAHEVSSGVHEVSYGGDGTHVVSMKPATYDELYIVDTADIRNTAEVGRGHLENIEALVGELQQEMAASEDTWVGTAGSWYRDVFLTSTNKYQKVLEEFSASYVRELVSYADEYDKVDSRATGIADNVEQPSM
jgi:uncharacterized protein YukE